MGEKKMRTCPKCGYEVAFDGTSCNACGYIENEKDKEEREKGTTDFYNLIIEDDIEPEFFGPFGNWDEMISAAEQHRDDDPHKKDGIYHITIPKGVPISIDTYQGRD